MALPRRSSTSALDIWPGFVDALATLLMVIIFLLMIFVVAQFFLNDALVGRDQALERLNRQVEELADLLSLERKASNDLRNNVAQLSAELQSTLAARDALSTELSAVKDRFAAARGELDESRAKQRTVEEERERLSRQLADAYLTIDADREKIEVQLRQLARLKQDIEAMTARRDELAGQLSTAAGALTEEQKISEAAKAQVALLNRQLAELGKQLAALNKALEVSEAESKTQKVQIADLGKRLNAALASKVQELARYRSEFFGRLRAVLGERQDIRVVGDRFVFQSEVLFDSASAELGPEGQAQMERLADALRDISSRIPGDIDWVLRVDGHTDRIPIATPRFASNWELSSARAISVVKYLISRGIPAKRLAAAGFGEYQPLDARNDEIALRRNRRIELKLTQR